jgi:CRP/FNR family transcriptional regulator, nitrogen fixation regulation protein
MHGPVTRENLGYRQLLANELDKEKQQIRRRLLADEKRKTAAVKAALETRQHSSDFSKVPIHRCNQQSVKSSILQLRRGPILHNRDKVIFCEGDPADYLILVVKGVVRTCKIYQNGERRIAAFYFPGETLGWNDESVHSVSAEAATDTMLLYIKRSALRSLAARDHRVTDFIFSAIQNELRRAQEHSFLMRMDAKCRVVSFLFDLWARTGQMQHLLVPMSYGDVADYLGLTGETLSRTITALAQSGQIARASKRTLVLGSLRRMAG